jgi:hypothetical protein
VTAPVYRQSAQDLDRITTEARGPRPGGSSPLPRRKARLERLGPNAVAAEIAPVIDAHENVGAALQFRVDTARRFELEARGDAFLSWRSSPARACGAACVVCV